MIIALHGFGSSGEKSSTMKAIKEKFKDDTVYTPTYDVTDPFKLAAELKALTKLHEDEELHIVGISFGGYLARWLAHNSSRIVSSLTMLNPVLDGAARIKEHIGVNKSFVGGEDIVLTQAHADIYKAFNIKEDNHGLAINLLVGGQDDIIDPMIATNHYKNRARVKVIHTADHRFTGCSDIVLDFIKESVDNIAG